MSPRGRNFGIRKVCECGRSRWPKCAHAWNFNFKPHSGPAYRFSLDAELGRHIGSKTEAEQIATTIRAAILAGTFRRASDAPTPVAPPDAGVTLDQFAPIYIERAVKASGKASWGNDAAMLDRLREHRAATGQRMGASLLASITEDELEAFYAGLQTAGLAASTRNQYVQILKASFRWATRKGYIAKSPLSDDSTIKRSRVAQRRRRLSPVEESVLLATAGALTRGAGPRLQWLIIAALETGCRRGELLAMRWADVNIGNGALLVRAVERGAMKSGRARQLPISARLAATLKMAQNDPAGRTYPPTAYVFGALGERLKSVKKAWETTVLRAHGHEPAWVRGALAPISRQQLEAVDLHFHDLRHEAGCRWLEQGWPIHHVQEMLGHANLSQTSTYLHATETGLAESMRKFDASRCMPVAESGPIEPPSIGNAEPKQTDKTTLH